MHADLGDSGFYPPASPCLPGDRDGDGYEPPADCDDDDEDVNPDATDLPYNGVDEDCDGSDLTDVDGDGWEGEEVGGEDCADANASINPDAEETCEDGRDNDCDGHIDEECAQVDPIDPGGMSWTCGHVGHVAVPVVLAALLLCLARRSTARR